MISVVNADLVYRCQNGRMQMLYLVQNTYHVTRNSDLYYLGLTTGTFTPESLANLTFSFFAFSYSFNNLAKARSGGQQLDHYFRRTTQVIITTCLLLSIGMVNCCGKLPNEVQNFVV
ncbi:Hypothetical protein PHPALM_37747 [Phytophthora palmivora]|uniref:Uncharacterized protein n=1 Tax=Phytophthora palmivora TaxID=4796 RepID=A0A2P4WWN3_9STRA|nr:Hypothetical protein PHPALM_37747 [Phytophthora palmivora]